MEDDNNKNMVAVTGDWFYMSDNEVSIRSIYEALRVNGSDEIELWESAGILELSLPDKASFDIELIKPSFKDPEGEAFLKSNQISTMYMVTFQKELFPMILPLMKAVVSTCGGFFCADTLDFSPKIS